MHTERLLSSPATPNTILHLHDPVLSRPRVSTAPPQSCHPDGVMRKPALSFQPMAPEGVSNAAEMCPGRSQACMCTSCPIKLRLVLCAFNPTRLNVLNGARILRISFPVHSCECLQACARGHKFNSNCAFYTHVAARSVYLANITRCLASIGCKGYHIYLQSFCFSDAAILMNSTVWRASSTDNAYFVQLIYCRGIVICIVRASSCRWDMH